ncbi:MAG: hypothetical protein KF869_00955 [Phycisphaeraceae bacterium]|nr:hypothetical protein [Phycisphaeraceae bacterium]
MPPAHIWLIVSIFIAVDAVVLWAVRMWVKHMFVDLAAAFPAREPATDAVRRSFQSFSIDSINMGWSVHVAADDYGLHLRPALLMRLFGGQALSIPWTAIALYGRRGRWFSKAKVGGRWQLMGPSWCLKLAEGDAAE